MSRPTRPTTQDASAPSWIWFLGGVIAAGAIAALLFFSRPPSSVAPNEVTSTPAQVQTPSVTTTSTKTLEEFFSEVEEQMRRDFDSPYRVQVKCTGDDSAGQQFCLAVEEEITSSPMFEFADNGPWRISLVTLDPDENANQTVISYALFRRETFLTHGVALYGRNRLNTGARGIISTLSEEIRRLR